jgi:hypothetical protein
MSSLKTDTLLDPSHAAKYPITGLPPHTLDIKVGGLYRLLRNVSVDRGLVKNIRVEVRATGRDVVTVRVLNGDPTSADLPIPRTCFKYQTPGKNATLFRR